MVCESRLLIRERAVQPTAIRPTVTVFLTVVLATTLMLLALSSPALADDSGVSVWTGQGVFPVASSDIRMDSETVQATCYRGFAEYRVDFKFVNEGQPQTLQLGFSSADILPADAAGDASALVDARRGAPVALRAWQDGKPLQVTLGKGQDPMLSSAWVGYYLHTARFPHGVTMITVGYLASAENGGYAYWLHTGAYWKGPIGKAIVRYRLADSFEDGGTLAASKPETGGVFPAHYVKLDDRTYQWVFDNLEPTRDDDVSLYFPSPSLSQEFNGGGDVAVPASAGAVPVRGTTSERLGPNVESSNPPGWEAIDGSPATAWGFSAEAEKWLQIGVRGNQDLREIRILPGRNDSPTSFGEYARPKTIDVSWGLGDKAITLKDEPTLQRFDLSCMTDNLMLYVVDTYPGTKSNDVYISEIDLGTARAPEFDTFANMMAGGTPPGTGTLSAFMTSTTSGLVTISTAASLSGTTLPPTTTTAAASTATARGSARPDGVATTGSPRLLWAVIVAGVVAAAAVGVSICLAMRLRGRGKASRET